MIVCSSPSDIVVLPAAIAVAEEVGSLGADTVTAIVAGYEVSMRVALGLVGRMHPEFRVLP